MGNSDETAKSYKTTADLILSRDGDKARVINYLLKAANLYGEENRIKAVECLEDLHDNLKGSTTEFGMDQYVRYLHQLARSYEDLHERIRAADIYLELAKEFAKQKEKLEAKGREAPLKILRSFTSYLAKALLIYDTAEKYDSVLKLARIFYKIFPSLQENENIHAQLFFCYEHIIHATDMTGSRYMREYYTELDRKLRESGNVDSTY